MATAQLPATAVYPPNWYPDPWRIAPWRWWDGMQWTPVIYGPYGVAWPLPPSAPPFVPKGPGVKGGGVAAVGAGVGLVGTIVVAVAYAVANPGGFSGNDPWYLLTSQLALWVGFVGAVIYASRINGTGSLSADYGLSWPRPKDVGSARPARSWVASCRSSCSSPSSWPDRASAPRAAPPRRSWGRPRREPPAGWWSSPWPWWGLPSSRSSSFADCCRARSPAGSARCPPSSSRHSSSASPTCSTRACWPPSCSFPWRSSSATAPADRPARRGHGGPCLLQRQRLRPLPRAGLPLTARPHCVGASAMSSLARVNTASNIGSVSFPVNVFCWLGW